MSLIRTTVLFLLVAAASVRAAEQTLESAYIRNLSVWRTPLIRPSGFQFEIQISSLGACYAPEKVRASITGHNLGEYKSAVSPVIAAEWGYSFLHLTGQHDGAGRLIEGGYPTSPVERAACLKVIETFLHTHYIRGAKRPWASMNGHYPWHHYAAEFGFDQIGSEIGENINNYQWHIALTRGAARQYGLPWFMDFSAWHGPGISDYSEDCTIWGEYSHPDYGHSMSLFERSLFTCYMAGAGQITAEAGGALSFRPSLNDDDLYILSPYGKVCKRFRDFTLAYHNIGIPCTPVAVVLDFYHGAYMGHVPRKSFGQFDYNAGDNMTWDVINLIWPGAWEVMGNQEVGALVNNTYGDTFDILLQNAPQHVLDSYPCLILSGDIHLSDVEVERYRNYVDQGGTLILNSAYLHQFTEYNNVPRPITRQTVTSGQGRAVLYGPDYVIAQLDEILREELAKHLPVRVSGNIQHLVNIANSDVLVTLINNAGVTKAPQDKVVIDKTQEQTATVTWNDRGKIDAVKDVIKERVYPVGDDNTAQITLAPGEVSILKFNGCIRH